MLNVVMLNVAFSYCYAECRFSVCHYAECRYADKTNSICQGQIPWSIFLASALTLIT